jgi:hypothetical protein
MESSSENEHNDVPDFPEVSDEVPAKYLESLKGSRKLVDPFSYVYEKDTAVENSRVRWRCVRKRSKIYPR